MTNHEDEPQPQPFQMITNFTRSNFCRVLHIDSVWGGITPQSNIHMALFNERWTMPSQTLVKPDEEGTSVLKDYAIDPPVLVTREIEADVILNLSAAIFLRDWLTGKINELGGPPQEVGA
jgi:hypothetical protein